MTTATRRWVSSVSSLLLLLGLLSALPTQAATATRTSAFDYDPASGLLTKEIIEPDNPDLCLVTTYTYDSFGNKTSATTRNCNGSTGSVPGTNSEAAAPATSADSVIAARTSSTTFDAQGRFPVSSTNALGQTETKVVEGSFGNLTSLTGPNGLTTTWTYDTFGRKLTEARADGTSTQQSYALCGTGITCPTASNGVVPKYAVTVTQAGTPTKKSYYDQLDRAIQTEVQDKDGGLIYAQTQYDHLGRPLKSSRPYAASSGTPVWTTVTYDLVGRTLSTTAPDGSVSSIAYSGLTTVSTNAKSQTRTEVHNSQGQLVSVTDTMGYVLTYQYDAYGNLTQTRDHLSNITTITYDARGRKVAMNDPDQGAWSYAYDALGQLKRQTDAKGQVVTFTYDLLGRMLTRAEPDLNSTWAYDTCDATLNPGGKCVGKPVKETSDNGYVRTYLYDTYSRPTAELDNVDTGYGVSKNYDSYGRVANLVYPTGFQTSNVYSSTGYLIQIKNTSAGTIYWQANTIDAEGRVTSETYGNGLINTKTYDANTGRLTQTQSGTSATPNSVNNQSYVFDALGNLTQRYDGVTGLNESFGYDNLNRLTATSAQASGGPLTQVSVTYNALGNILTKSDIGSYTYGSLDATNKLIHPHAVTKIVMNDGVTVYGSYTYDANGNQLSGASRTVTWNSWNMPTQITGSGPNTPAGTTSSSFSLVYNSAHERVKETLPDGTLVYNISPRVDTGIHVEKRVKPDGTITYVNSLYAGSFPFGTFTTTTPPGGSPTTKTRYFHTDHLGSIVAITDESGNVTERRSYDAWGKHRNLNGTSMSNAFVTPEERHGFTGHEELDDVGLVDMNGRLYDPATGRFLSADPTIQMPGDLQNYNRYSYINNNPLAAIDASGYGFFGDLFQAIFAPVKLVFSAVKAALHNSVIRTAIAIYVGYQLGIGDWQLFGNTATMTSWGPAFITTATETAMNAAVGGFAAGMIASGGHLRAGINGAFSAALFAEAGNLAVQFQWGDAAHAVADGVAGGVSSVEAGGDFKSGFLSAGFSEFAGSQLPNMDFAGNLAARMAIGGTASVLGGGKFGNGAMTSAYAYMFNECIHKDCIALAKKLYSTMTNEMAVEVFKVAYPGSPLIPKPNQVNADGRALASDLAAEFIWGNGGVNTAFSAYLPTPAAGVKTLMGKIIDSITSYITGTQQASYSTNPVEFSKQLQSIGEGVRSRAALTEKSRFNEIMMGY